MNKLSCKELKRGITLGKDEVNIKYKTMQFGVRIVEVRFGLCKEMKMRILFNNLWSKRELLIKSKTGVLKSAAVRIVLYIYEVTLTDCIRNRLYVEEVI